MSLKEQFRRIEELFHELVELPQEEREARLEQLQATEPKAIYEELERLLRRHDPGDQDPADWLEPMERVVDEAWKDSATNLGTLGPYRLVGRLGEGGMGVVYEAEQVEPIRRTVAIKVVRSHHSSDGAAARFEVEKQALARMRHPNVAQVHDAGTSEDGRPYFVMELVEGQSLLDYCDRRRLTIDQRLELFLDVCAGVHHAHQKGILHRDLKPSNILVTEEDGRPLPKIIDFGIAKALSGDVEGESLTRHGDAIGTLEYMSPEQTLGSSQAVDTRADVYALGVVLYELLTGDLPIRRQTLREAGLADAYRLIQQEEPPAPSRRLLPPSEETTAAAARRATTPMPLARHLKRDLDWIAMKALAKEPERRYPSASELRADVARYLRNEPVLAGPPGARYRLYTFVRRHRVAVVTGGLVLLALLTGIVGTTLGLLRAREAEATARRSQSAAIVEAETAREVTDFLIELFRERDPNKAQGRTVTAEEILERGVARIDEELPDQPQVRARLLAAMGRVYTNLGLYDKAAPLLEQALEISKATLDATSTELAASYRELGRLFRLQDEVENAEDAYRAAIDILETDDEPIGFELAQTLNELGLLLRRSDPEAAREAYVRARDLLAEEPREDDDGWQINANIAALDARAGRYDAARDAFRAALEEAESLLGSDNPQIGMLLGNLAFVERKLGHFEAARELQERDLALSERVLGADHPSIGTILINLSAVYKLLGDYEAAARAGERALTVVESTLPESHQNVATARNNLAETLLRRGDYQRASQLLEKAHQGLSTREDAAAIETRLRILVLLSTSERLGGDARKAATLARTVIEAPEIEPYPATLMDAHFALAYALAATGRQEAADRSFEAARGLATGGHATTADGAFAEAVYWALRSEVDRGLAALERAVQAGYRDARLFTDADLASLRSDPRFSLLAAPLDAPSQEKPPTG